jgi:hypothetical protein
LGYKKDDPGLARSRERVQLVIVIGRLVLEALKIVHGWLGG